MKRTRDIKNDKAEQDSTSDQKVIETQDRMEAIEGLRRELEVWNESLQARQKSSFENFLVRKTSRNVNETISPPQIDRRKLVCKMNPWKNSKPQNKSKSNALAVSPFRERKR